MSQFTAENTGVPTVPTQTHLFSPPTKRIHDSQGLQAFQHSTALSELQQSLGRIVFLIGGLDVPDGVMPVDLLYDEKERLKYAEESVAIPQFDKTHNELEKILHSKPYVAGVVELLKRMSDLVDAVPAYPGPRRYGNMACREWHTKLEESVDAWLEELIMPFYKMENGQGFVEEVKWYIVNCFGSKERLDYGTGHELAFLAFLTGLWKVRIIGDDVDGSDFLVMFGVYYNLVRKLILTYTLEPAGSHGVWGLDDHFHIIYILGASQMLGSDSAKNGPSVSPKMISNRSVVYHYSSRNLYFNAIAFIYKVKKGSFFEHSPLLYDVSNVKNWEKILKGMLKMYQVEVFGKFPVVQHFYFGSVLFPWTNAKTGKPLPIYTSEEGAQEEKDNDPTPTPTTVPMPVTAAPWNKQPTSFQEDVTRTKTVGRTPPPPETTRAPWGSGAMPSTRAPWSKPGDASTGDSNVPTTKAPWAK